MQKFFSGFGRSVAGCVILVAIGLMIANLPGLAPQSDKVVQFVATPTLQIGCEKITIKMTLTVGRCGIYGKTRVAVLQVLPNGGDHMGVNCAKSCTVLRINDALSKIEKGGPFETMSLVSGTARKSAILTIDPGGVEITPQ